MSAHSATSIMSPKGAAHRRLAGRLVIATHNPGKLKEMRELLMPYGIEAASVIDYFYSLTASLTFAVEGHFTA